MIGYIGTYTKTNSDGIYIIDLDTETGKMDLLEKTYKIDNPTYLIHDNENKKIYSICENREKATSVASIVEDNENLTVISVLDTKGQGFCHLCIDEQRKFLVAASYRGGYFSIFELENGIVKSRISDIYPNGINGDSVSHCHYAGFIKDKLFIVDLGIDKVLAYDFDRVTGETKLNDRLTYTAEKGSGPRHIVFNEKNNIIYLLNELNSTINVLKITEDIDCLQTLSTIPDNIESSGAAIKLTKDGKYLYASNRGHDSIAGFEVLENGELKFISYTSTGGLHPRDFEIDPTDKFLLISNMNSDNILSFKINKENGTLTKTGYEIKIPMPVCIKF